MNYDVLGIIKLLVLGKYDTLKMTGEFERNKTFLEVYDDSTIVVVFNPKGEVVVLYIRLIWHYKIHLEDLQQCLSKYYSFESLKYISWVLQF